jgi:hypothetical protein
MASIWYVIQDRPKLAILFVDARPPVDEATAGAAPHPLAEAVEQAEMGSHSKGRPEDTAPPDVFYNETEASKYLHSSRMIDIQTQMSERALEMLCLPEDEPCMILDVGCGTGLSGEVLEENGHSWVGVDISRDMLSVAQRREVRLPAVMQACALLLTSFGSQRE